MSDPIAQVTAAQAGGATALLDAIRALIQTHPNPESFSKAFERNAALWTVSAIRKGMHDHPDYRRGRDATLRALRRAIPNI